MASDHGLDPLERLRRLVTALEAQLCAGDAGDAGAGCERIETHISVILLTAELAYKFKKPVDLGFVDFATLDRRHFYCEEELRLNRRLLPEWYLDVVTVGGTDAEPRLESYPAIEFAVRMRRFPPGSGLDEAVAAGRVEPAAFAELGREIARFHEQASEVPREHPEYGSTRLLTRYCEENFAVLERAPRGLLVADEIRRLQRWTAEELRVREPLLERRRAQGRVRECHGDMHLTNMLWLDGRIRLFDCIEFNAELRFVDVINDIAFLIMDLDERGRGDLARIFLDAYLQACGDYEGLALLRLFCAYRSLVRAKVACLALAQADARETSTARDRARRHVALALGYTERPGPAALIITHGLSGSGKSSVAQQLIPVSRRALRLRSDVERKRLQGLAAEQSSGSGIDAGLYSPDVTERTYRRLLWLARKMLEAGHPVIVDATFPTQSLRARFQALAEWLGCPFHILECRAPMDMLRRRVARRAERGQDVSEAGIAVLERQRERIETLSVDERMFTVTVDTTRPIDATALATRLGING